MELRVLRFIQKFTSGRTCWFLLFLFSAIIESCALYFQYGLNLRPCVECVYERAAVALFGVCGLMGMLMPAVKIMRFLTSSGFLASSIFGLTVSIEHYLETVKTGFGATCRLKADFPSFLPLDEWMPFMFRPLDTCGPLDWSLLGLSMPEWIMIIFSCGIIVSTVFILSQMVRTTPRYDRYYR